ncbi:hypothetical protein D3C85_1652200 [compost metagenome]
MADDQTGRPGLVGNPTLRPGAGRRGGGELLVVLAEERQEARDQPGEKSPVVRLPGAPGSQLRGHQSSN